MNTEANQHQHCLYERRHEVSPPPVKLTTVEAEYRFRLFLLFFLYDMQSIVLWPVLAVLAIATFVDCRSGRIPNWLVLPFLLAGFVASLSGYGSIGFVQSLSGFALAVTVAGVLCWLRGMGMGDLKLLAAIGAWIGPEQLTLALVVTGITGGLMAVIWAARHGVLRESFGGAGDLLVSWKTGLRPHATLVLDNPAKLKMPYAPAIAVGTIFSFFGT